MKVYHYNYKGAKNIGDRESLPSLYFDIPGENRSIFSKDSVEDGSLSIFGGGIVLGPANAHQGRKIMWGGGDTVLGRKEAYFPHHNPEGYLLYGTRDYGHGEWVPCASCMSTLFDSPNDPIQDIVFYGHKEKMPFEELNNDCMDFECVINHLSRGETVVTSSYHGMYWSLLLGRKVVAIPFGSKFYGLPWDVALVDEYSGQQGKSHPNALSESREANLAFFEKVKEHL